MAEATLNYGIQECSKCEYKSRCEECVYSKKGIQKIVEETRKETAEKFAERAKEEAFVVFMGEPIIRASKIDEIAKEITEG